MLIPLLFMGDVVGRLFREFADHAGGHDPDLGRRVADADADDVRASCCASTRRASSRAASTAQPSASSTRVIARYGRDAQLGAATASALTLLVAVGDAGADGRCSTSSIPKGFFPVQDTGVIQGISEAPQIDLVRRDGRAAAGARRSRSCKDPAVESLSSFIGVDGTNTTLNSGRMLINLKPHDERDASASEIIRRLQQRASRASPASRSTCSRCRT